MKSGRVIKETAPYHRSFGLVACESLLEQDEQVKYPSAISQYELQKKMGHPLALAATTNPDILYAHEAMKALTGKSSLMQWKLNFLNMK